LNNRIKIYYSFLFLTTVIPFLNYVLPFIPYNILGFNLTGWAWLIMLVVTLINLYDIKGIVFPIFFWIPWILYIIIYAITFYSFLGLQLTLQYILPILVGIVVSGFTYETEDLEWILSKFRVLCIGIGILFAIGYLFRGGFTSASAATPMLFSILFSLVAGLYFITRELRYLIYLAVIFLVPVIDVTRMGIAALAVIFVVHFANNNLRNKIIYSAIVVIVVLMVFYSKKFQEKTFFRGHGDLSEISLNYYENQNIRSSGRQLWKKALEAGLKEEPVWGNGPRADIIPLTKVTGRVSAEAHNDYLSVRYNYGYVGLGALLSGFILTFISLFRISRKYIENDYIWYLSTCTLTLFISFLMFMYSDNILKYTIFFPNYFFALIGIVYSLKRDADSNY
jgi:hypothetical protein